MQSGSGAAPRLSRTRRARRDDVVAAAVRVIGRDGHAAASVERIAAEAGTTKGTVLYHFRTKEAVDTAVVDLLYEHGAAYMTERVRAATGHRDRLHAYLASNLRFIAENAAHVRAVHRILENHAYAGGIDGADAVPPLRDLLAAGQRDGAFGSFDPQVLALVVRAVVDGAAFHFTAHPGLDVEHHVAEVLRIFDRATAP